MREHPGFPHNVGDHVEVGIGTAAGIYITIQLENWWRRT